MTWVVYQSRPLSTPWPSTILDIARASETTNAEVGASGMLLFSSDSYVQYIEGPQEAVESLWDRISADSRHEVVWSRSGTAAAPRFGALPMGYFDADREASAVKTGPLWRGRGDWSAEQAEDLIGMFETIAREKYPSAMSPGGSA